MRRKLSVCLLAGLSVLIWVSTEAAGQQRKAPTSGKAPTIEENQRLLQALDEATDENDKLIQSLERDLIVGLGTTYVQKLGETFEQKRGETFRQKAIANLSKLSAVGYGGYQTGRASISKEYLDALYQLTTLAIAILGEVPKVAGGAAAAQGFDLFYNSAQLWLVGRYQSNLLKQTWDLGQALQSVQCKGANQAACKRILDNLLGNISAEHDAFKKALAKTGQTEQSFIDKLFRTTKESDPFRAVAVTRGLSIVDPQAGISTIEKTPCINPDFVAALRKDFAHANDPEYLRSGQVMFSNKDASGNYIPAFSSSCDTSNTQVAAPLSNTSHGQAQTLSVQKCQLKYQQTIEDSKEYCHRRGAYKQLCLETGHLIMVNAATRDLKECLERVK